MARPIVVLEQDLLRILVPPDVRSKALMCEDIVKKLRNKRWDRQGGMHTTLQQNKWVAALPNDSVWQPQRLKWTRRCID